MARRRLTDYPPPPEIKGETLDPLCEWKGSGYYTLREKVNIALVSVEVIIIGSINNPAGPRGQPFCQDYTFLTAVLRIYSIK